MNTFAELMARRVQVPDRRAIRFWAGGSRPDRSDAKINFGTTEAFKGPYDVENVPWTDRILTAFKDPTVREITAVMPPQESGKTKAAETCLSWRIDQAPAKMAFNVTTDVGALKWQETRWDQMITACPAIRARFHPSRFKVKRGRIIFRDGTFLLIQGAEKDANRQGDTVEVQVNDEVHLWEKPWLRQMHTRTRAYRETRKILNISVGGDRGSELHERFLAGTREEWHHHCPKCDKLFAYVHDSRRKDCNISYDMKKVVVHADGTLDLRAFDETVRIACQHCGHSMAYDEDRLAAMNLASLRRGDGYVAGNAAPEAGVVSLHVNAFAIGRRRWSEVLEPWVRAHLRTGVFSPQIIRTFICEDLAEFNEDRPVVVAKELRLGAYKRVDVLKPGAWRDEWIRLMFVDNQRGSAGDIPHRWFVCRAFSRPDAGGRCKTRLVDCGRINEWSELRAKQIELGVPDPTDGRPGPWVLVDRRHDPAGVDEICAQYRWYGVWGTDAQDYEHGPESPWIPGGRALFSEPRRIDIGFGTREQGRLHAVYFLFADQKAEDVLASLRGGRADAWEVPQDIMDFCPDYAVHINAHRQEMRPDRKGREKLTWVKIGGHADHLYDCEKIGAVAGLMAGVYRR